MAKTKYQSAALDYAKDYLDRLLDMEDYVGRRLESKIGTIVESKLQQYSGGKGQPDGDKEQPYNNKKK